MNERIRELLEQARNYALDEKRIYERMHNTEQCMEEYREVYNKKFAELIIRKCAEVAWYNTPDWEELEYGHLIEDKILKHFGVEE
jgi:hypothetical protein